MTPASFARRAATAAALSIAAAVAATSSAAASDLPTAELPADVTIGVVGNTIRATIAVHGINEQVSDGHNVCNGPWVHTEASANRILNSPDIDLAANPDSWMIYQPDSPNAALTGAPTPLPNRLYLGAGQSGEAMIPAVADGKYVAGVVCGQYHLVDGRWIAKYTSLKLYPLTVGTPVTPQPDASGSLTGLGFGSS